MAGPITWRNVESGSNGDAIRGMYLAQQSLNSGFDKIGGVFKQRQDMEDANWNQQKANNTAAFQQEISKYDTPEAYQEALKSGAIHNLLGSYGAQIDQAGSRQLMDGFTTTLMNRANAVNQFQDAAEARRAKPVEDLVASLAATGQHDLAIEAANSSDVAGKAAMLDRVTKSRIAQEDRARQLKVNERTDKLATLELADKERAVVDQNEARLLQTELSAAKTNHLKERKAHEAALGQIASRLKLPTTANGLARVDDFTTEQRNLLGFEAKKAGIKDPFLKFSGDTQTADAEYQRLLDSGKFRVETLDKNREAIRGAFDSTNVGGLVGQERADRALKNAQTKVAMDKEAENNWHIPGSQKATQIFEELSASVGKMIGDDDPEDVNKMLYDITANGIQLPNGDRYTPSKSEILNAIASTNDGWGLSGWFGGNGTGSRADKALELMTKRGQEEKYLLKLKAAKEYEEYQNKENVKKLRAELK